MSEPGPQTAEEIFLDAIEIPSEARVAFLDEACGGDDELRRKVEQLIAADEAADGGDFLESAFLGKVDPDPPPPPGQPTTAEGNESTRFSILSQHQQGGIGEVLIAHDRQLKREVAIKQIKPKWRFHHEARQRFVQEAEVTGRLEHPGVVPVYAMGTWDDGRQYYAMRFIQGQTLAEVIRRFHDPENQLDQPSHLLELRQILNRFIDVCNTIQYAHSRNILHRDIKPANIMVGDYGETLVVDWGLAKLLDTPYDESMTADLLGDLSLDHTFTSKQIGGRVGTPQYMSPEQAAGQMDEVGIRTDIYLLGATLYQILTGQPPHADESITKLLKRIAQGELIRPRLIDPGIPAPLEAICLKAMATDPADRYRSSAGLAADIERWMADEPVSAYTDPPLVRLGRSLRRHRTIAYSGAVALILLMVGTIVGTMFWSHQQTERFTVEREKDLKEAQLRATRLQRLTELRSATEAAAALAEEETRASRFASALNILEGTLESIGDEPELQQRYEQLQQRADRLRRLVTYYEFADRTHEQNLLSRDTKAILSCTTGLQALGILDRDDWWAHLPDQDLTAAQQDELRWSVYQQLLTLDAMLVKTIGRRLSGSSRPGTASSFLPAMRRLISSDAGKREASAALIVSDRAELFRHSEAVRWFRSVAKFRLREGRRLRGSDLDVAYNAPDAQSLGVLSLISALDESFQMFFKNYQGKESLLAARDLFSRSSKLRPDYYWVQLSLAQCEYLLALRDPDPSWRKFDSGIQAAGRCIAMQPEKCFAYADRSSMYRSQARTLAGDEEMSASDREQLAAEILRWSLADAEAADRLGADQPWIGWQHGLALYEIGEVEQAVERFLEASKLTYPFIELEDATLVRVDDLRGRREAVEVTAQLAEAFPKRSHYDVLLASIKLNQKRFDEASELIEPVLSAADPPAHAHAIRGMILLQREQYSDAADDFLRAAELDPTLDWAGYGLAACYESLDRNEEALAAYIGAESICRTDEHRAGCLLGQCRLFAQFDRYEEAIAALTRARQLEPACDIMTVVRPVARIYAQRFQVDPDDRKTLSMKAFLRSLSELPRATKIEFTPSEPSSEPTGEPFRAALLNSGFELGRLEYWHDASGPAWNNEKGYDSIGKVSSSVAHGGTHSLHVIGTARQQPDQMGSTGQDVPVRVSETCRVTAWVKAKGLEKNALRLVDAAGRTVATAAPGTYDWTLLEGTTRVDGEEVNRDGITMLRLEIVCSGTGEAWIDDLEVLCQLSSD